jgi:N-methylhydantoinase A/oxoprolinase/acetone carboxylase beta subunit
MSADPGEAPEAGGTPAPRGPEEISGQLGLGIDAGGTYTDCVLYDLDHRKVICKAKALTTHHNLSVGIDEGLKKLSLPEGLRVALVALSTTLATNSIVEGKGGRPGAIIMTPLTHNPSDFKWRPLKFVGGALDIRGNEQSAPDREEIAQAVRGLLEEGVDAFAVSGYASVRNPEHELLVREVIAEQCGLPIVCGHELSSRLDYLARANTAILNARLLSVIGKLLEAVRSSLSAIGVAAPIMVVKGDGSLINEQTARERPVETILSGPAASVSGARHLTEVSEGIVFDMGGTTTDTAVLSQGLVRIHPEGATVGGWRTSVEAADIATVGLGGDSHISFNADRELLVGPRRVLPLCYLAAESEDVKATLERLEARTVTNRGNSQALEFFRLGRDHEDATLDERSLAMLTALQEGPLSRERLARRIGLVEASLLRTEKLEDLGYVQRSSLTPTDLLHVTGEFVAWDVEAARLALSFFAGLYGAEPEAVIELVREQIVRRLCLQVLHHVMGSDGVAAQPGRPGRSAPRETRGRDQAVLDLALAKANNGPLQVSITYSDTIVALGAPVQPFFPEVARRLNARLIIPEHAEVANAIGAVASEVVVRERAIVRPGELSAYVVHTRSGKREFEKLETAVEAARADAERLAVERASRSGAASPRVRLDVDERRGLLADGAEELIEVIVEATAAGRPELQVAT